ncbi:MAG: histidinol dehydrogenase [Pyrinomonadaceae bacterium]
MQIIKYPTRDTWAAILKRPALDTKFLERTVANILADVRNNGDEALRHCARHFDKVELDDFLVTEAEFVEANLLVSEELKDAIAVAKANIEKFHIAGQFETPVTETSAGVTCWTRNVAIERVGLYVPAGSAPLFSTVLMLAVPANLAGCGRIVITSPPGTDGKVAPVTLYTAQLCGATEVFKIGGAQAIGALAYGTETVPRVDKIFGPGNQFVTEAKLQVLRSGVAIDMPAGPSEVAVLADVTSVPSFVAADLLAQAEHGPDSQVILVSTSEAVVDAVFAEVGRQTEALPRKKIVEAALANSKAILVADIGDGIDLLNEYAPEHLILATDEADNLASRVINAGSVFLGNFSCESAGDYASGTNHTLPTGAAARAYSGVSVSSFTKTITYQRLTAEGIRTLGPAVEIMAAAEGLDAHKNAVTVRLEWLEGEPDV